MRHSDLDAAPPGRGDMRDAVGGDRLSHRNAAATHRHRDPLRHPAARGRLDARPRRGRRRRALRAQVPRRGPGRQGAGGRGGGRRAGPRARARGAGGQGGKGLVAEVVGGELARALGLAVPEIVAIEVDPALGAAEPDPEIQDLISSSAGVNAGLDFLPGSLPYAPAAGAQPSPEVAAEIVWLDALITNVDHTPRNPNLLVWHDRVWLIDHGAALYFHHREWAPERDAALAFPAIRDHVLLPGAGSIHDADERLAGRLSPEIVRGIAHLLPAGWADAERYAAYLTRRLASPRGFAAEAEHARLELRRAAA